MSRWSPSADEERWLAVAARWPEYRGAAPAIAGRGAWRSSSLVARLALAALGIVIAAATNVVAWVLHLPAPLLVAAIVLLLAAEHLIGNRHFWASGIEEALWFGGAVGLAVWTAEHSPPALLVAIVALLAGLRLGNALLILAAALAAGWQYSVPQWPAAASWLALALLALWAAGRSLRRPWHDQALSLLMCALPLAAYLAQFDGRALRPALLIPALAMLAVLALLAAWRRRVHPPLLAALVCSGCIGHYFAMHTALALHYKLLIDGALILLLTLLLERRLRTPWRGIDAIAEPDERADLLQVAGAAALTPASNAPAATGSTGSGGGFGGGGSSGRY
jgi:hypothetical protein